MKINYITGYAGTGKSYKLIQLVKRLPKSTSVVIAPTHKALGRLSPHLPSSVEIKTIHSLIGWIPYINSNAKHIDHISAIQKLNKSLDNYTNIIIDEAGMMSQDMLMEITSKIEEANDFNTDHISLHIFLDPYQLLPVKGQQVEIDLTTTENLTIQHRSEAPDIVNTYTKFVHYLQGTNSLDLTVPYSKNILPFDIIKFKKGDRLLAYTNNAVGNWNKIIAKQFGITSYIGQEVQLGVNNTTIVDAFIKPTFEDLLSYYEDNILLLQNRQISKQYLESSLRALLTTKGIEFIQNGFYIIPVIVGIDKANQIIRKAKEKAIENKTNFKQVYALNRAFIMDYTFTSTVHKAQGSEFSTVFIDREDIKKSIFKNYYQTYARLMYVALSRAIKKIYI